VECVNKGDSSNNRGNWNNLKIIQTAPGQHIGKVRRQGTKKLAIFGTAKKLRKALMSKPETYFTGAITLHWKENACSICNYTQW